MRSNLIVHVTAEYRDSAWGGIATAVDLMASSMARDGFSVLVVSCGASSFEQRIGEGSSWVQVGWANPSVESLYLAPDRVQLGQELSTRMCSVIRDKAIGRRALVFVHNEEFVDLVWSLRNSSVVSAVVAVSHGLAQQEHPNDVPLIQQQERFLSAATAVAVVSESQARLLNAQCPLIDPVVIPLPLALYAENVAIQRHPELVIDRRLVAAGRPVPQKGFAFVRDALALLTGLSSIECYIYSRRDAQLVDDVQRVPGTLHSIRHRQWIQRSELLRRVARAHALVVPSLFEPLGLIAAEAMSLGTPVIASDVGGLGELVSADEGVGALVKMGPQGPEPSALAQAIAREIDRGPRVSTGRERLAEYSYSRFLDGVNRAVGQ